MRLNAAFRGGMERCIYAAALGASKLRTTLYFRPGSWLNFSQSEKMERDISLKGVTLK